MENESKRGCLRTGLIVFSAIIVLLVVLGITGSLYQTRAQQAFLEENPAPGEVVDIGGRNMHIHCTGEGNPTVILDAGQGGWSIDYVDIQAELSTQTRVCTYDRAGYGWSDPADDNRTVEDISNDLNQLLNAADIETPVVLVAFSFSGLPARYYYQQYPDDLAGLVLIDPAHEADRDIQSEELLSAQRSLIGTYSAFEGAASIGLVRILEPQEIAPYAPFIAENHPSPDLYYGALSGSAWWATSRKEFATNLVGELPSLPDMFDIPVRVVGLTNSIPDEAYDELNQDRLDLLQSLVDGSDQAQLILFDDIAHGEIVLETALITELITNVLASINTAE